MIGIQDYNAGVSRPVSPFNDIELVGKALRQVGYEFMRSVRNANRALMLKALDSYDRRLKQAGKGAIRLIYHGSHGIASKGTNHLIPIDVERPSTHLLRAHGARHSEILSLSRTEAPDAIHYLSLMHAGMSCTERMAQGLYFS